jgi:hypothetical protein|tara:strand:+ start:316 stop:942 length:627 start_codon:yes stop_codon:yes gene_type:complete
MKAIPIKKHSLITRLDSIAEEFYRLPHKWKHHPLPKTSAVDLKAHIADAKFSGHPIQSNSIDWVGRTSTDRYKRLTLALLGAINDMASEEGLLHGEFYYDTILFQPPATGWTGWHNGGDKPRKFVKFIHNSGYGFTNYIKDGKRTKIEDRHRPADTKDWTCLIGELDGSSTWMSDRNMGDTPRLVIDISIKNTYNEMFANLEQFIKNV